MIRTRHVGSLALQLRCHPVARCSDDASKCIHQNTKVTKKGRQESVCLAVEHFEGSVGNVNEIMVPWGVPWPRNGAEGD